MNAPVDVPEIVPVSPPRRAEAFALVFSHQSPDERQRQVEVLMEAVASGEISPQGLLGTSRGGQLTGAVFAKVEPGRAAMVWTPRLIDGEPKATAAKLLDAASQWLAGRDVRIAQIQVELDHHNDDALARAHGYQSLGDLLYLVAAEGQFPVRLPQCPLDFEPYDVENHKRLAKVVEATYQETLDCPQLNGVREIEDVIEGYRATGVFDPSRWLIVRHDGKDVGCLLLADHPEHENWELVYMGVAAAHRGHGWGMAIARHAQWLTRQAGRPRLVLAVDAGNAPAIKMYAAVGFQAWERRSVLLRVFGQSE